MTIKHSWWLKILPRQLRLQVGLMVSVLLLMTIGMYAWHTAREQSEASLDATKSQTAIMAKSIANLSMNYLLTEDFSSMQSLLLRIAEFPNVQSISVTNKSGLVLSQVIHAENSKPKIRFDPKPLKLPSGEAPVITAGEERLVVWYPVFEGSLFGWVKIDYSLRAIADLQRRIWNDSFIAALFVVAASITFIMLLLNRPIRAFRKLTDFATRLHEQKGATVEVQVSSREIEQLASALNTTSRELFEQDRSLKESGDHLEELRRQNALILESAGDGILRLDKRGKHIFINPAAARMLGYESGELIGRPAHETWHYRKPDGTHYDENECPTYATLRDGQIRHTSDELFWRKDGTSFPVEYTATPIREGDRVTGAVVTFKDISPRKKAEEAVRMSEERFRQMSENIHEVFWMASLDFSEMIYISPAYEEIWGRTRGDLYKNPKEWLNAVHPDDRAHVMEVVEKSRGTRFSIEYRIARPDGSLRWIHDRGFPVRNEAGQVYRLTGIAEDITVRRQSEDLLRKQFTAFESSMDGMAILNKNGEYQYVNNAHAQLYGYDHPRELMGQSWKVLYDTEELGRFERKIMPELWKTGQWRGEAVGKRRDGSGFPQEISLTTLDDGGLICVVRDITERKKAEETLWESEQRYRSLFDNMLEGYAYCRIMYDGDRPSDFIYLGVNNAFEKLTGLKNVVGKKVTEVVPGIREADPGLFEIYGRVAMTGKPERFEMYVEALSIWFSISVYSPKKEHFVSVFDVITERKQAEEALRQSEEFLNSIIENIPATIFVKDAANLRFVIFNRAAEELLGYSREEMLGKNDHDFFPAREADLFTGKDREVLRNNFPVEIPEETIQSRHHGERILHTKKIPILDKKGNPRYLLGISEDITERKLSERKIEKQVKRLAALRDIDMAITSSLDLRLSTNVILREIINQLSVDAADILLLNADTQTLTYADARGFRTAALKHTQLRLGDGHAGRAALERRTIRIQNVSSGDDNFSRSPLFSQEGFADYFGVPLISKGKVKGVLEIFHRTLLHPDQEWLDFLEALGAQAAIAVDNAMMFNDIERSNTELILAYESTLEGWSRALDYRDKETEGHSKRVTEMAVTIARAMGMSDDELVNVRRGALLHDIGKLGVPDNILLKPGKLTDEEWVIMKKHPTIAHDLISPIPFLKKSLDVPYCHHEKWNGTGYPRGLKGEEIPLAARIFSVVDVWDALRSDRPYRPAWSKEKTMEYILQEVGTGFDPKVVDVFLNVMKSETA